MKAGNAIAIVLLLVLGCEEPIRSPLSSTDTDLLIVEGLLSNEKTNHLVKLSHPYKTQNGIAAPAPGATVTILEDATVYTLTESPTGSGYYYTPEMRAVTGKIYTLIISYQGKEYTAQDSSIPVEAMSSLDYYPVNDQFALSLYATGQDANYVTYNLSWKNTATCLSGNACEGKLVYYDLKTIDVHEIYKPDKEDFTFPAGTTVVRTKHSVSPAYKIFLRAMLSETEWRGGVFDVQRDNVPTNLNDGGAGFFAVCTVLKDTSVVNP